MSLGKTSVFHKNWKESSTWSNFFEHLFPELKCEINSHESWPGHVWDTKNIQYIEHLGLTKFASKKRWHSPFFNILFPKSWTNLDQQKLWNTRIMKTWIKKWRSFSTTLRSQRSSTRWDLGCPTMALSAMEAPENPEINRSNRRFSLWWKNGTTYGFDAWPLTNWTGILLVSWLLVLYFSSSPKQVQQRLSSQPVNHISSITQDNIWNNKDRNKNTVFTSDIKISRNITNSCCHFLLNLQNESKWPFSDKTLTWTCFFTTGTIKQHLQTKHSITFT